MDKFEEGIDKAPSVDIRDESQGGNGLIALFKNELIVGLVTSYLNLADMKALSEVSFSLSKVVRDSQSFKNRAMIVISEDTFRLPFLAKTTLPWMTLSVDISLPNEALKNTVRHILGNVHTLELQMTSDVRQKNIELTKLVHFLVTNAPNLKALWMESVILQELVFVGRFPEGILPLSQLSLGLETIQLFQTDWVDEKFVKSISGIVARNQNTLQELGIHSTEYSLDGMAHIICPNLKRLKLNVCHEPAVSAFLTNHSDLEELTLHMKADLPAEVIALIRGQFSKLRKLHLTGKVISDLEGPVDWTFLQGMENLKDFSISRPMNRYERPENFGTGAKFLSVLPHQVTRIGFKGLDLFWFNVWPLQPDDREDEELETEEQIRLLAPFSNMTELSLMRCEDALNDQVLQYILKEFGRLRVFEVSHCDDLTDFGLTGVRNNEDTGISLRNLRGLTRFKIRACPWVTPAGLREAVKLPFLRHFDYLGDTEAEIPFVVAIAEQNPSLESITVLASEELAEEFRIAVKEVNSRTRYIWNVNADDNWAAKDSDSDADDVTENTAYADVIAGLGLDAQYGRDNCIII